MGIGFGWALVGLAVVGLGGHTAFADDPPASLDHISEQPILSLWTRVGGEDWPQFLGPRGNGTSLEQGLRRTWPDRGLPIVWSMRLGTSYGLGVVQHGRYFQFCRHGDAERLTCLEAETGHLLWQTEQPVAYQDLYGYNDGPRSSPAVDGSTDYTFGVAGRLTCYAVADGKIVWSRSLHEEFGVVQNFFGAGSSPILIGDLLIVMVGGSPPESQQVAPGLLDRVEPAGSAVVAVDRWTGETRWKSGQDLASYSTPVRFDFQGRPQIAAFCRNGLLVLDAETGETRATFPWRAALLESVNAACPVVANDQILVSECYEVGASLLKLTNAGPPEIVWQDPARRRREQSLRAHWATPILIDGFLYGASGRNEPDADFRCVRWSDGAVQWIDPRRTRASALAVDGHLVVLNEHGLLELLRPNPARFERVAQWDLSEATDATGEAWLEYPCWAAPMVAHGLLWVRGRDRLLCLDLRVPDDTASDTPAISQP
jgi:outer membrane protein assembly factor BamB